MLSKQKSHLHKPTTAEMIRYLPTSGTTSMLAEGVIATSSDFKASCNFTHVQMSLNHFPNQKLDEHCNVTFMPLQARRTLNFKYDKETVQRLRSTPTEQVVAGLRKEAKRHIDSG